MWHCYSPNVNYLLGNDDERCVLHKIYLNVTFPDCCVIRYEAGNPAANPKIYWLLYIVSYNSITFSGTPSAANAVKGLEHDSSDSSDNESKDPYKLKDELAAVGRYLITRLSFKLLFLFFSTLSLGF